MLHIRSLVAAGGGWLRVSTWSVIAAVGCRSHAQVAIPEYGPVRSQMNGSFYFRSQPMRAIDAFNAGDHQCAKLVTINDALENSFVLNSVLNPDSGGRSGWIGLADWATEGQFFWATYQPITYTNWAPGMPDNGGGIEDYVELLPWGQWNDRFQNVVLNGVYEIESPAYRRGPVMNPSNGRMYYTIGPITPQHANWLGAVGLGWVHGGSAARIKSPFENEFIRSRMMTVQGTERAVWIAATDAPSTGSPGEGQWVWSTGEPLVYTNWAAGEPNNSGGAGEHWAEMWPGSGVWNDVGLWGSSQYAVIERESAGVGLFAGPFEHPSTGRIYYLTNATDWHQAEETALRMGGHLAAIDDADEHAWLVQNVVPAAWPDTLCWIGLTSQESQDASNSGAYRWSNGQPVTWTNWWSGEPSVGGEMHGAIWNFPGGAWNNVDEYAAMYGIVEIPRRAARIASTSVWYGTIQSALNAAGPGDTVIVAPGVHREELVIDGKSLTLQGDPAFPDSVTIDLAGISGTQLTIGGPPGSALSVVVDDVRFANAGTSAVRINPVLPGSAYAPSSTSVTFRGCEFEFNVGPSGGAIDARSCALTIDRSIFRSNRASPPSNGTGGGGAVRLVGGSLTVTDAEFEGNSTRDRGGAIHLAGVLVDIRMSDFVSNRLDVGTLGRGGGIYADGCGLTVVDSSIIENTSSWQGAAMYLVMTDTVLEGSMFSDNVATGGVINTSGDWNATSLRVTGCTFENPVSGYAVWAEGVDLTLDEGTTIVRTGGTAVYSILDGGNELVIDGASIVDSHFSGLVVETSGPARCTIANSVFTGNGAFGAQMRTGDIAGGVPMITIDSSRFEDNAYDGLTVESFDSAGVSVTGSEFRSNLWNGLSMSNLFGLTTGSLYVSGGVFESNGHAGVRMENVAGAFLLSSDFRWNQMQGILSRRPRNLLFQHLTLKDNPRAGIEIESPRENSNLDLADLSISGSSSAYQFINGVPTSRHTLFRARVSGNVVDNPNAARVIEIDNPGQTIIGETLISGNQSVGPVARFRAWNAEFRHVTIAGNVLLGSYEWYPAVEFTPGSAAILYNSIIWNESFSMNLDNGAGGAYVDARYCNIRGGWGVGTGSINADPLFRDPDGADDVLGNEDDDFRLRVMSPCIDAAQEFISFSDLDGSPRPFDNLFWNTTGFKADMGAYEAGCFADFDGSGFVDGDDFDALVQAFEAGGDDSDFDGSGFVDGDDFDIFVWNFEAGC